MDKYLNDKGEVGVLFHTEGYFVTENGCPTKETLEMATDADLVRIVVEYQAEEKKHVDEKGRPLGWVRRWNGSFVKRWLETLQTKYPKYVEEQGLRECSYNEKEVAESGDVAEEFTQMDVAFIKQGSLFTFVDNSDFDNHGYGETCVVDGIFIM